MQLRFVRAELPEVEGDIRRHLQSLPGPIDSFLEGHVLRSKHYVISVSGARAGFCSIHGGSLITQFWLEPGFQQLGQAVFQGVRRLENVGAAFVPTCDEFFLSHAIDDCRQLAKQAYFFEQGPGSGGAGAPYASKVLTVADEGAIREASGDFFGELRGALERGELFATERDGVRVGFGVMEHSRLLPAAASVGMFTLERFRGAGVGTATIALLLAECARRGVRAVAGCWYYNHASRRTLERAGMVSRTRLLKVEY